MHAPADPVDCNAFDSVTVISVQQSVARSVRSHFVQRLISEINVVYCISLLTS